jgi:hypothetical protein
MDISLNSTLIRLTEAAYHIHLKTKRKNLVGKSGAFIESIDRFCLPGQARKRALISLLPSAWERGIAQYPNIKYFNQDGLTVEIIKALNELGYVVDLVDWKHPDFIPARPYDFYMGHGGFAGHTRRVIDHLPRETFVLNYASGAYGEAFNRMSQERYDNFCKRKSLPFKRSFVRSLLGTEADENYLARRADATFLSGPRTCATLDGISKKTALLYLGSYVDQSLLVQDRDFEAGRRNFIYVAGTGGNVQKGMDLLLETFSRLPEYHLYIHCRVEAEVLSAYRRELALPNIHYTYHYSRGPLRGQLLQLLRKINFTISAPIDTGPGTAFLGSMGLGLIPVGYVDINGDDADSVLTDSYSIDGLMKIVQKASSMSAEWCREASRRTIMRYHRLHVPSAFGGNFKQMLIDFGL